MSFAENLQSYRKILNLTQEDFAEKLEVSRQSVSKWESGATYPETEKLLIMCKLFNCSLDDLMLGNATKNMATDKHNYDQHQSMFAKAISFGVFLILLGVGTFLMIEDINETIGTMILLSFVMVAVVIFIASGILHSHYASKHPIITDFYTEQEKDAAIKKFIISLSAGIAGVLIGVIFLVGAELLPMSDSMATAMFIYILSIAVPCIVYSSMQYSKYDIESYNEDNMFNTEIKKYTDDKLDEEIDSLKIEKLRKDMEQEEKEESIMEAVMLIATAIFLFSGFIFDNWRTAWVVFPIFVVIGAAIQTMYNIAKK